MSHNISNISNVYKICKVCKVCNKKFIECDTCFDNICDCNINHINHTIPQKCIECFDTHTCNKFNVCLLCLFCISLNPFHFITDNVAVGNRHSSYEHFDIIIDLNYPDNGAELGKFKVEKIKKDDTRKIIIRCGIIDCALDKYLPHVENMFDAIHDGIKQIKESKNVYKNILFHCFAGISRSVAMATYYLSKELNISYESSYKMIKEKRKIAKINQGFAKLLEIQDI